MRISSLGLVVGFCGLAAVGVACSDSNPVDTDAGTVDSGTIDTGAADTAVATFPVGGTVAGLVGGGLVLQNNAGDDLTVAADGAFAFKTPLKDGAGYAVTIKTQPVGQTCVAAADTGKIAKAAVTTVKITCTTNTYTIGGTVMGLVGGGLVLQDNGADDLTIAADGPFTFATKVAALKPFAVTVKTQPIGQTCVVTGGTGNVAAGNITSVAVNCKASTYTVSGTITGLTGAGAKLQLNGKDDLVVNGNTFAFPVQLLDKAAYAVTVFAQPTAPWQTCTITAKGSGAIALANVTDVAITCVTNKYTIGGTLAGLKGSGLVLQNNAADNITKSLAAGNGPFKFATPIESGKAYAVTVKTQPTAPNQVCSVANGASNVAGADVTNTDASCVTTKYTIGGNITGLPNGATVVLQNNAGDDLSRNANGAFTFATSIDDATAYKVTVKSVVGGSCNVTLDTGNVAGASVVNVAVACGVRYAPVGPQENVSVASATVGWTECFKGTYNQSSQSMASILAACSKANIMMACRPTNGATLQLLAQAPRADVFFDTGAANNNVLRTANGTSWYYSPNWSYGFAAAGDSVNKDPCDNNQNGQNSKRMCVHTGNTILAGYRCGAAITFAASYERIFYHAD
jgi:large repetitive protein